MEVTRANFDEVLETLPEVFEKAQFITFDTEFTGLRLAGTEGLAKYDTLETLYIKDKAKVENFMVIQYGIVVFFYNENTNRYTHQGYNFYVFPSASSNVNFMCQASSMQFLVEHGFNFNKLFSKGIPYLRDKEVEQLISRVDEKCANKLSKDWKQSKEKPVIPDESKELLEEITNKIDRILNSGQKGTVELGKHWRFTRKLIYSVIESTYGDRVFVTTNEDETMTCLVGTTMKEYDEQVKLKYLREKNDILSNVGFSKVLKLISNSRKLFIGHNVITDLLFTIKQFLQPLPDTLKEFIELTHFLFPYVVDTKYLGSIVKIKNLLNTGLPTMVEHFEKSNDLFHVDVADGGVGYSKNTSKEHEAACDAYLTGICFLSLCKLLGKGQDQNLFRELPTSSLLKPAMNKLSIPKLMNQSCLDLEHLEKDPDRSSVFYVQFPKEWVQTDLVNLFKSCVPVNIGWLSNTSAYVSVNKLHVHHVHTALKKENSNYKIYTFREHLEWLRSEAAKSKPYQEESDATPSNGNGSFTSKRPKLVDLGEVIQRPAE